MCNLFLFNLAASSPMSKTERCITKIRFILAALFSAMAISGCGFQLAGTTPASEQWMMLDSAYVVSRVGIERLIDQPVAEQIKADLQAVSLQVSDSTQVNTPGILILDEEQSERGISLNRELFDRQIDLEKRVQFQILDASGNILLADSLSVSRELINDPANPSAKQAERHILTNSLNRDISRQLIRRFLTSLSQANGDAAASE